MKNRRLTLTLIIGILLGVIALMITLYPLIGNYLSTKNKSEIITEYTANVGEMEDGTIQDILSEAYDYNAALAPGTLSIENVFSRAGQQLASEDYYDILKLTADGIMGYVEIPKIAVYLPIYHGTDSDVLDVGVGHLIGSSFPVGGESTHAVLTGHSGMAREKMFSDLDQLKTGDTFYIHIMNQTLAYEVDQIKIVLPENTEYLSIERGEDYCTLVTCTPFGVNTHRLLVRGHRVPYFQQSAEVTATNANDDKPVTSTWKRQYLHGLTISLCLLIAALILSKMTIFRKRGKHEARPAPRKARKRR